MTEERVEELMNKHPAGAALSKIEQRSQEP